jgi:hypothetical protein
MQQRGAPVEARPLSGSSAMARVERLIFETSRPGLYPQRQACTRKREQAQCHFQIGRAERPRVELAQRVISTHCLCPSPPVVTSSGVDGEDVLPLTSAHRRRRCVPTCWDVMRILVSKRADRTRSHLALRQGFMTSLDS